MACRAMAACTKATSRASPSIALARMSGVTPALRATRSGSFERHLRRRDHHIGRRPRGADRRASMSRRRASSDARDIAAARRWHIFRRIASASAEVVGSATVGPEAITQGSSPGTSEIIRVTTRAGAAAAASLPPLIADKCRRTQFISEIVAPLFRSALLIACLSASVTPSAGKSEKRRAAALK